MKLSRFAALYDIEARVVTAYLDVRSDTEDARTRLAIIWKDLLRELGERGVDEATIRAVATAGERTDLAGTSRVLVAGGGSVRLDLSLPDPALAPGVHVGMLPRLLPLFEWHSARRGHIVVLADRTGADVVVYPAFGDAALDVEVGSASWPLHKTGSGGWSARRFDAHVEEAWERNARAVAELIDRASSHAGTSVVVGSGDERALTLIHRHLGQDTQRRFVTVAGGGRHEDGGGEVVQRRIKEAVAAKAVEDELAGLERFSQALGREAGGVEGAAAVVAALQQAQVDTLVVTSELLGDPVDIAFGPQPTHLAIDAADLEAMGVSDIRHAPLIDVVLRAAVGTDADVLVVEPSEGRAPADGLGALQRYSPSM